MIKKAISLLTEAKDLDFHQMYSVFSEIFNKKATPAQIAAFLIALKIKGPTHQEISAAASVLRKKARKVKIMKEISGKRFEPVLDTCSTGGSGVNKFNISTGIAFVVASLGVKVAKHGNRAMSSSCGSADVLEKLGIEIGVAPGVMEKAIKELGIGFLYAPLYHPAFGIVSPIRKELGVSTIFNILGPLCNPAFANCQLLGVFKRELLPKLALSLKDLGVRRAFVVYGTDLKDEVSLCGPTEVIFLSGRKIARFKISPSTFGLRKYKLKEFQVRNVEESARILKEVFEGKNGPHQDIIAAGASCCFYLLKKVKSLREGVELARSLITQGRVRKKFLEFREFLQKYKNKKV